MRANKIVPLMLLPLVFSCKPASAANISTKEEKLSYSFGVKTAENYMEQDIDVNTDAFVQGFKDSLTKQKLKMTTVQIDKALNDYQQQRVAEYRKQQETMRAENLEQSKAYLDANKQKQGVSSTDSGLQYQVITAGNGPKPKLDDFVLVNYKGTLIDGTEFDSSYKRNRSERFQVKGLIKGWQEALTMMPAGSKWSLVIPPDLAYGENGAGNVIQPNSVLLFELELVAIDNDGSKQQG